MKKFSEQYLVQWIKTQRRESLILRGARQVGKSTLVRQFADQQNLLLNEINFERHPKLDKGACPAVKNIGKPCAGKLHAWFDEGGLAKVATARLLRHRQTKGAETDMAN